MTMTLVPLMRHLRRLAGPTVADPQSDAALLERFVQARDEDAFAVLVERHGPMVLRVCRRVLGDHHAAEDVFQACFLMLARRAASIRQRAALAGWLHAVALRLALKARAAASRKPAGLAHADPADTRPDPLTALTAREAVTAVDQEIERLGEVYRLPVLLCCIEGLSQEEAAQRLGWSAGSVKGRLERGRKRLHARLTRRGLTLAAVLAASELAKAQAGAAVPTLLASTTVTAGLAFAGLSQHALPPASAVAARLAGECLRATAFSRVRTLVALILLLGVAAGGVGAFAWARQRAEPPEEPIPPVAAGSPAPQTQRNDDGKSSPPFEGKALPEPPQQKQPWTPPADAPKTLAGATAALFDAGMADPRGGEYRAVVVGTGDVWSGDAGRFQTHAWVLPAAAGAVQRFAIGWNGLVYPVVSVGERADLTADIRAILKKDEEARAKFANNDPQGKFSRIQHAWRERYSLASDSLLPLKACLLLRLGEGELASALWSAWMAGIHANVNDGTAIIRDPYLMLATDWAWALFDRAVGAHMRGDDRLALLSARALSKAQKVVEEEAQRRGFERQTNFQDGKPQPQPYLSFLTELPALLADQERRATEPRQATKSLPREKPQRIAALVGDLENAAARQFGQPGGVSLGMAGPVAMLVHEGEDAVEPLLKCLEQDQRLTRSVSFHRDFFMHRHILGVHEAAYAALTDILKTTNFGPDVNWWDVAGRGMEGRRKMATAIRKHWARFQGVPLEERWFRTLADDGATVSEWLEAANHIVEKGEGGTLRGEALRKKENPSVVGLLARRIDSLWQPYQADQSYLDKIDNACRLAYCLEKWAPKPATPILAELVRLVAKYIPEAPSSPTAYQQLSQHLPRMTELRVQAGDRTALAHYAVWLRTVGPKTATHSYSVVFAPLWQHPDDPDMRAVAEAMFGDDRSPWAEQFLLAFNTNHLFQTAMMKVAPFRKRVLTELTNKDRAGIVKLTDEGYGQLAMDTGWTGGPGIDARKDPLAPKGPAKLPFRVCDYYAFQLSRNVKGAPRCELYWPEADRDRAVTACAAFLQKE